MFLNMMIQNKNEFDSMKKESKEWHFNVWRATKNGVYVGGGHPTKKAADYALPWKPLYRIRLKFKD